MAEDKEVHGSLYFRLTLDDRQGSGLFTEATGGGSENAIIEQKCAAPDGKGVQILKIPGNLKYNDITLKRGIDKDMKLWEWRQLVVSGQIKKARCNGTIEMLDSEFNPVAAYSFERGWVSKYTPAGMNAGQDQAAIEEITICVEKYERVPT
jgi:phage tail-like protein